MIRNTDARFIARRHRQHSIYKGFNMKILHQFQIVEFPLQPLTCTGSSARFTNKKNRLSMIVHSKQKRYGGSREIRKYRFNDEFDLMRFVTLKRYRYILVLLETSYSSRRMLATTCIVCVPPLFLETQDLISLCLRSLFSLMAEIQLIAS